MRTYMDKDLKRVVKVAFYGYDPIIYLQLVDITNEEGYRATLQEFLSERFEEVI